MIWIRPLNKSNVHTKASGIDLWHVIRVLCELVSGASGYRKTQGEVDTGSAQPGKLLKEYM